MILGRFTYLLSNGQKWNVRRLKHFLPSVTLPECDPGLGQLTQWSPITQRSEAMEEWASHGRRPLLKLQAEERENQDMLLLMPEELEVEMPRPTRVQAPEELERWYPQRARKKTSFYTPWC